MHTSQDWSHQCNNNQLIYKAIAPYDATYLFNNWDIFLRFRHFIIIQLNDMYSNSFKRFLQSFFHWKQFIKCKPNVMFNSSLCKWNRPAQSAFGFYAPRTPSCLVDDLLWFFLSLFTFLYCMTFGFTSSSIHWYTLSHHLVLYDGVSNANGRHSFFVHYRCAYHIKTKCKDRFVSKQSESMDYGLAIGISYVQVYLCNKSFILLTQNIQCTPASATTSAIITELALI